MTDISKVLSHNVLLGSTNNNYELDKIIVSLCFLITAKSELEAQDKLDSLLDEIKADNYKITVNDYFFIMAKSKLEAQDKLSVLLRESIDDCDFFIHVCLSVKTDFRKNTRN